MSLRSAFALPGGAAVALPALRRPRLHMPPLAFVLPLVGYLTAASLLVFVSHVIQGDAWSRVGNASYVLFSRDPHLAAFGFTWNPLPSVVMLPLLPFRVIWPALVSDGFAANIVSAVSMAGAVYQLERMLRELDLSRVARAGLVVVFAISPLVIHYGANGMSEAPFLFFLLAGVRYLSRWLASPQPISLAASGIALALAYLTRYEGLIAAAAAFGVVCAISFWRAGGDRKTRSFTAFADLAIIGAPVAVAFLGWAAASWIITGSPFEVFTGAYGNESQLKLLSSEIRDATGQGTNAALGYALGQIFGVQPFLLAVLLASLVTGLARRDPRCLAGGAILGAVLAFELWAFLAGKTYGNLRYYIVVVPLAVILVGTALARRRNEAGDRNGGRLQLSLIVGRTIALRGAAVVLLGLVAWSIPASLSTMTDARLGRGESYYLSSALRPDSFTQTNHPGYFHEAGRRVAEYLDSLHLPEGAVLADAATSFPVILHSRDPRQFVITPDRDFKSIASDPVLFHVRYVLIAANPLDVLARLFPSIGDPVAVFGEDVSRWRLYKLSQ